MKKNLSFNIKWLYEYLFFNFPIGETTFLKDVKRMPPASFLEIDIELNKSSISQYEKNFENRGIPLEGPGALEYALDLFRERVPKYFGESENNACALTGGWDGRTNLSFCPSTNSVVTYTYGVPGCGDLVEAQKTAEKEGIKHKKILFDEDFTKDLPFHIFDTVFLSSGTLSILRATLLYVYANLNEFSIVISGVSGGQIFRGNANVPASVSYDMNKIFRIGWENFDTSFWREVFAQDYENFNEHIINKLNYLEDMYGKLTSPNHHLSYLLYEVAPNYFGGEFSIAKQFATFRNPFWDEDIIDFAFSTKYSTLFFSNFSKNKTNDRAKNVLQAYLISNNTPSLAQIPVNGYLPGMFLKSEIIYQLYRLHYRAFKWLPQRAINIIFKKNRSVTNLEDWNKWLNSTLKPTIDNLIFSEDSMIQKYIKNEYLEKLKEKRDLHWIGKLATIEIILRLIDNNWERFW